MGSHNAPPIGSARKLAVWWRAGDSRDTDAHTSLNGAEISNKLAYNVRQYNHRQRSDVTSPGVESAVRLRLLLEKPRKEEPRKETSSEIGDENYLVLYQ